MKLPDIQYESIAGRSKQKRYIFRNHHEVETHAWCPYEHIPDGYRCLISGPFKDGQFYVDLGQNGAWPRRLLAKALRLHITESSQ